MISGCVQNDSNTQESTHDSRIDDIKLSESDILSFRGDPIDSSLSSHPLDNYNLNVYRYKWTSENSDDTTDLQIEVYEYKDEDALNTEFNKRVDGKKDSYQMSPKYFLELTENVGVGEKSILTGTTLSSSHEIEFIKENFLILIHGDSEIERSEILDLARIIEAKI